MQKIIAKCLELSPKKRPSINEIIKILYNNNINIDINSYFSDSDVTILCKTMKISINRNSLDTFKKDRFEIKEKIGQGKTSKVFKAYDLNNKKDVALKRILWEDDCDLENIYEEKEINNRLKSVNHPAFLITQFYKNNDKEIIGVSDCAFCDLKDNLSIRSQNSTFYTQSEIIYILRNLIGGLLSAEKIGFSHLDIKPLNIVIMSPENPSYKFIDFGTSILTKEKLIPYDDIKGFSLKYLAPEIRVLRDNELHRLNSLISPTKADIFSLGLIALELMGCSENFISEIKKNGFKKIGKYFENEYSELINLLKNEILVEDPNKRIDLQNLFKKLCGITSIKPDESVISLFFENKGMD